MRTPSVIGTSNATPSDLPSTPKKGFSFFQNGYGSSTLASLGAKAGVGFFRCVSFLCIKGFLFVYKCVGKKEGVGFQAPTFPKKKYDLLRYEDFCKCFKKDPIQGCNQMLDLLQKSPQDLKGILLDATSKTNNPKRQEVIAMINEKFTNLLMSPEVLFHAHRVIKGGYENNVLIWLKGNDGTWDPKGKDPEVISARSLQKQHDQTMEKASEIWKTCYAFIQVMADLSSLKLLNGDKYQGHLPKGKEPEISLGDFVERLHHKYFALLTARDDRFEPLMEGIVQVLGYLNNATECDLKNHPQFQALVQKAHRVLLKKENQDALFDIVTGMINRPGESPKKRRLDV